MMYFDTTWIEPDFSLVKFKKLVGGGSMEIVNQTIPRALEVLGYAGETIEAIVEYIAENGHVIDAPGLKPEHYEVFETAVGVGAIKPMGHVHMMAAVQPFLSGAISKTVNLPEDATVEDIADLHMQGWKLGLKAIAIYRDNCKVGQPLSSGKSKKAEEPAPAAAATAEEEHRAVRRRLPRRRDSQTTSFSVGGAEGYVTASAYGTGELGEIFLRFGKHGSTLGGVMDAFSIAVSIGLQYGVPLETFVEKFTNLRFEPAGMTDDPDQRMASSIMDYVFRRLAMDYLDFETRSAMGIHTNAERARELETGSYAPVEDAPAPQAPVAHADAEADRTDTGADSVAGGTESAGITEAGVSYNGGSLKSEEGASVSSSADLMAKFQGRVADAPLCMTCGARMRPSGSCHVCEGCGTTSGCS